MAKWYYADKGERVGPVEQVVVEQRVASGLLTLVDRVLREGDDSWRLISECPEFAQISNVLLTRNTSLHGQPEDEWVVLKTVQEGGKAKYTQVGPYGTGEVLRRVHAGELRFQDYIWKAGMSDWARIRDVPELQRQEEATVVVPPPPPTIPDNWHGEGEDAGNELFANVLVQKLDPLADQQRLPSLDEVLPIEVEGGDLAADLAYSYVDEVTQGDGDLPPGEAARADSRLDDAMLVEDTAEGSSIHDLTDAGGSSVIDYSQTKGVFSVDEIAQIESARAEARRQREREMTNYDQEQDAQFREVRKRKLRRWGIVLAPTVVVLAGVSYWLLAQFSHQDGAVESLAEPPSPQVKAPEAAPSPPAFAAAVTPNSRDAVGTDAALDTSAHRSDIAQPETVVQPAVVEPTPTPPSLIPAKWSVLPWSGTPVTTSGVSIQSEIRDGGRLSAGIWLGAASGAQQVTSFRLLGKAGKILDKPSLHRVIKVELEQGKETFLAFASLGIPLGTYEVFGLNGNYANPGLVEYGTAEPDFAEKLAGYKQKVAKARALEIRQLKTFIKHLEGREKALAEGGRLFTNKQRWDTFAKKWKRELLRVQPGPVKKVSWRTADQYHYPDEWMSGREIRGGLIKLLDQRSKSFARKKVQRLDTSAIKKQVQVLGQRIEALKL